MRIFLRLLSIVFLLLAVAFTFILLLFDPNQYREQIQDYLKKHSGLKVRLGYLSLYWDIAPGIKADRLAFLDSKTDRLLLDARNVTFKINFPAVLSRKILITSSNAGSAEIFLVRKADGHWLGEGGSRPDANPWIVFLPEGGIQKAILHFLDESVTPPLAVNLYQMDVHVHPSQTESLLNIMINAGFSPKGPPHLSLRIQYSPDRPSIAFQSTYERGKVNLEGFVRFSQGGPYLDGKLEVHRLDLARVIPGSWRNREHFTGVLTAQAEGKAGIKDFKTFQETLYLKGVADIRRGALKNVNVVREIVHKIVAVPEGIQGLLSAIPPEWSPMFESNDTSFDIFECNFELRQGRFLSEEVRFRHQEYLMELNGTYGFLEREVNFSGQLVFLRNFSDYMIQKIKGLSGLQNQQGRMVIPFTYQGVLPDASAQPTIPYATSHFQN